MAQGLEEWLGLDVADRPADLHEDDLGPGLLCDQPDAALDLVGDVRDHLDRAAEEIAAPLLLDDLGIDLPAGEVADAAEADVNEAFIVTQIQVGFSAVIQHEDFAMLVGAHRAGIDVDVRIQLLHRHLETAFLEGQAEWRQRSRPCRRKKQHRQ